MGEALTNLSYDAWKQYIFDHPVADDPWYNDDESDYWDEESNPDTTVQFMTRLFNEAGTLPDTYSLEQIAQGLTYIVEPGVSGYAPLLGDDSPVPWELRQPCLRAMERVFADLFAPYCEQVLYHVDTDPKPSLNKICYQWWVRLPFRGRPDDAHREKFDRAYLDVMEATLQIKSVPCNEATLHGLGYWHDQHPGHVARIVDEFVKSTRTLNPDLHYYARRARRGEIV